MLAKLLRQDLAIFMRRQKNVHMLSLSNLQTDQALKKRETQRRVSPWGHLRSSLKLPTEVTAIKALSRDEMERAL